MRNQDHKCQHFRRHRYLGSLQARELGPQKSGRVSETCRTGSGSELLLQLSCSLSGSLAASHGEEGKAVSCAAVVDNVCKRIRS